MVVHRKPLVMLICLTFFSLCFSLSPTDNYHRTSLGLRAETNINSIDKVAFAAGLVFDYSIIPEISLGLKSIVSKDFFQQNTSITTIETLASFRFYPLAPAGKPATGLYAEAQGGATILLINTRLRYTFNAGIAMGYRFGLKNFYVEPEIRGGLPYILGLGLNVGFRF